jgi:hypothetical protein
MPEAVPTPAAHPTDIPKAVPTPALHRNTDLEGPTYDQVVRYVKQVEFK